MIEGPSIFKPVRQVRVTEDIFEQILSRVADGTLKPGEKLPSERELALKFEVSRSTVRETLRMLEHSGVVRIRYGSQGGAFVAADSHTLVSNALRLMVRLTQTSLMDLLEARKLIESATAALAAKRASREHLARMRKSIDEMEKQTDDQAALARANEEFHIAIAQAAGNPILLVTMQSVQDLIARSVLELVRTPKAREFIISSHTEIYEAIAHGNPEASQALMIKHIESIERQARKYLQGSRQGTLAHGGSLGP